MIPPKQPIFLKKDNPPLHPSQEGNIKDCRDTVHRVPTGSMEEKTNPLDVQIGGNHYKGFAIQPVEYTIKNDLSFLQGCIIKRISRYDRPGGKGLQDLKKIKHEIDLIIELENWEAIK